ncbi:MAG: 5-methyltetrahydrofolate--homocysteine methyltransferase [Candidatus Omnitrophica bacterium]|nr:5-methyltetrahydrofolate--homocysteine methyltransferase [Candidatus Omnitrophota bacterium]
MNIRKLIAEQIVILDGALGTEAQKRGLPAGVCPERWLVDHPRLQREIHAEYCKAGAHAVYTPTFGANRVKLGHWGEKKASRINAQLAAASRKAVPKGVAVAGDIGPTGDFVEPFGELGFEEAVRIFKEQVRGLADAGVDLCVIETMMDIQEARAALLAVKEETDLFTLVTMTFEQDGRTLNGTDPVSALVTLQSLGADAVGCNCSTGPEDMVKIIARMKPYATVPLVAKPNAGMPVIKKGEAVFGMTPQDFARSGKALVKKGVNLIGGCCGTTPAHIRALRGALVRRKPVAPVREAVNAVSSARRTVEFRPERITIIGECINPTGKKSLQSALKKGDFSPVRELARAQAEAGADLLDVNAGMPGIDQRRVLLRIIDLLSVGFSQPLSIDSHNKEVVEGALRKYPGRALLNSVSAEPNALKELLPVAARYGAMIIGLPIGEKGIPSTSRQRQTNARKILRAAKKYGMTKKDILFDGLAMAVSSDPKSGQETLDFLEWCRHEFAGLSVIGLSNISFGLPMRRWLNASFLALAKARGLTAAIANPAHAEIRHVRAAVDLFSSGDMGKFLEIGLAAQGLETEQGSSEETAEQKVYRAVLQGDRDGIVSRIREALKQGAVPLDLVDRFMTPAMNEVGARFEKKEYFLPQLIVSAETMKHGFEFLKPKLRTERAAGQVKTVVILATVKGDIHDIGKNIVALMLQNHGFSVVDLGKDVSTGRILKEIARHDEPVVGLSALMTTTMVNMGEVIERAEKEKVSCRFVLGGAVVTREYARSLGAEYARDGVEAVKVVRRLSGKKA